MITITDEMVEAGLRTTLSSVNLPAGECLHATDVREVLTAALSVAPAGVERTPGAKEAFSAIDLADRLISSAYGDEVPKEWHKAIRTVQKARAIAAPEMQYAYVDGPQGRVRIPLGVSQISPTRAHTQEDDR